ncbi:MAG TPA: MATE family efflux transporter [Polyangiaceae bacterium]|nr:MATE family efflux transporter [Polyangiaceae bacterium]
MNSARHRILQAPLAPAVLGFGLPLAVGMALQVTFNLVDAYLVSRLGQEQAGAALGAIGICDQLAAIGSIISYGYTTAAATMVSHREGSGDPVGARSIAYQSTLVVIGLGLLFALVGLIGSHWLMADVMGAKGLVLTLGADYLRVIVTGNVTIFLLLHLTSLQRALGSSKTPILLLVASNALNLVFAVLLIFGSGHAPPVFAWGPPVAASLHVPRMGLLGAAWATVLARLLVLVPVFLLGVYRFGFFRKETRGPFSGKLERELWHLAWPASTQLVVRVAAMLAIQSLVAHWFTTSSDQTATTALGVVFRLETMALFVGLGWGSAAQTFVGQNLGAQNPVRAKRSGWVAAGFSCSMMALLTAVYVLFGRPIVRFFAPDPAVVRLAFGYMQIVGPSYVGLGLAVALGSALQAAKRPRQALLLDMMILFGIQLPAAVAAAAWGSGPMDIYWVVSGAYFGFAIVYAGAYYRSRFEGVPTES